VWAMSARNPRKRSADQEGDAASEKPWGAGPQGMIIRKARAALMHTAVHACDVCPLWCDVKLIPRSRICDSGSSVEGVMVMGSPHLCRCNAVYFRVYVVCRWRCKK